MKRGHFIVLLPLILLSGYVVYAATVPATKQVPLTAQQVSAKADNSFADGIVPLGDNRYTTTAPRKGYIYLCNPKKENGGAFADGPWITGKTWSYLKKATVEGSVSWPTATFKNTVTGATRTLMGNGLPTNHATGVFPIARNSVAGTYDKNPNSIRSQTLKEIVSANPVYSNTPYCMGGEVGVMLNGVPLFNGFDATLRDAMAHEVQDKCGGHPQVSGQYHYHGMSPCLTDIGVETIVGYALDGFPITGPKVSDKKFLSTDDLDECHGITSPIKVGTKKVTMYHYVLTRDFPYSVSCFRGKPSRVGPRTTEASKTQEQPPRTQKGPPDEAITVCKGKSEYSSCTVRTPQGTLPGACIDVPEGVRACVPALE